MIAKIITDPNILAQQSEDFVFGQDEWLLQDMLDTANEHKASCAGLAAIQIGVPKRVILVRKGNDFFFLINPTILKYDGGSYYTTEGCLSVDSTNAVRRYRSVMVGYMTKCGKKCVKTFTGYTAQIIQHEVDHLNGITIDTKAA